MFMKKIHRHALYAAFALAVFLAAACKEDAPPPAPKGVQVVLAPATEGKAPIGQTFIGHLAAKETVEVRARVSGYLAEKLFEEGSFVKAGQLLYRLDDRDLKANLDTAKANTAKAKANMDNETTTRDRMVKLAQSGAVSLQMRDNAVSSAEEAAASYKAAQSEEERAAVNLGYATITAPVDGFIDRSDVEVGSNVDAGNATLMTTIYKIDPIRAEFSVTDSQYTAIRQAMDAAGNPTAVFHITVGDARTPYPLPGKLEMADPVINQTTGTLGVRALFPNPENKLRPGMYVNVTATAGEQVVLLIPDVAIIEQQASKLVYTVGDDGLIKAVTISTGALMGDRRIVTDGLKAGEKVVVEGQLKARPGLPAIVVEKAAGPAAPADGISSAAGLKAVPPAEAVVEEAKAE